MRLNLIPSLQPILVHSSKKISTSAASLFKLKDVQITRSDALQAKPDPTKLVFGHNFTDHMFECAWDKSGWKTPRICPVHSLDLHPAAKVFHYGGELFEGLKAYRGIDDKVRLFRPDQNMKRMAKSAARLSFHPFDETELLHCIKQLISMEKDWVFPCETNTTLYVRPAMIGTEPALGITASCSGLLFVILSPVGSYYTPGQEIKPVKLLADPKFVRAWPGGTGDIKLGCNYAPTLYVQKEASKKGYDQILWLFGPEHQVTEVGTMNVFVAIKKGDVIEVVTPPLGDGLILPGITRDSVCTLIKEMDGVTLSERRINMSELKDHAKKGNIVEMFGTGTAAVVSPIGLIHFEGEDIPISTDGTISGHIYKTLTDLQYGKVHTKPDWMVEIS